MKTWGSAVIGAAIGLVLVASLPGPVGAAGVRKGTRGIVEVEFVMTAKGNTKTADRQQEWRGEIRQEIERATAR